MMGSERQRVSALAVGAVVAGLVWHLGAGAPASAAELISGPDLRLRWDTMLKLSGGARVQKQSPTLLANINGDDSNRNFDRGLISGRGDVLSELDLSYRDFGLRISGAGWFDLVYHRPTDNDSEATVNSWSRDPQHFNKATRNLHGRRADLLDAFGFVSTMVLGLPVGVRAGRHTLLWGESVLMADNGISNAQAPVDAIKALSVPASQAKELFMPVTQVSGQIGPWHSVTLAIYYQLEWRRTRIPAAGSYFSSADVLDTGGQRLLLASGSAFFRGDDLDARNLGQWGASLRFSVDALDADLGLYYLKYHDKAPQVYLLPGRNADPALGKIGEYLLAYHEDIRLVGASFATTVLDLALAGEAHVRFGVPLASTALMVGPNAEADNDENPLYALGNTLHAQLSGVHVFTPSPIWAIASVAAEVGLQRRLAFTKNEAVFDRRRMATAWGYRIVFTPSYFQVLPNLDLNVPLSFAYNPRGRSSIPGFNGGPHEGGTTSAAISAEYRKLWLSSLQFSYAFGDETSQPRKDRAFVSLALQRTF